MKPEWCSQDVWRLAGEIRRKHADEAMSLHSWERTDFLIARALIEAHQRGRREGMEESAEMIESIGFSANFIRAKIDEVQK